MRGPLLLVLGVIAAAAPRAESVNVKTFSLRTQREWLEGEARGVRLTARGEAVLGPRVASRKVIEEAVVWALAPASDGGTWVGTGSTGRLLHVPAQGEAREAARFAELQVTALLVEGDAVLAATGPDGAVYRLRGAGPPVELARPRASYIWALARGADGALYAATGVEGAVFRIVEGQARVHVSVPDVHVVSLLALADGRLVAGTAERGLVLDVSEAGKPRVLYDSAGREARALLEEPDGGLVVAVNGGSSYRDAAVPGERRGEAVVSVSAAPEPDGAQAGQPGMTLPAPETLGEVASEVLRLRPGRAPEFLARLKGEIVYGLARHGEEIVAGTSKRLVVLEGADEPGVIGLGEGGQVSALLSGQDGVVVATTGPSRLLRLGLDAGAEGLYTTRVLAADGEARWGTLRHEALLPPGAALVLESRSGGSAETDATWSEWQRVEGEKVLSPPARYLQLRVRFTGGGGEAPRLRWLAQAWLAQNLAPVIKSFAVHPLGVVFQKAAQGSNVVEALPPPLPGMFEELGPPRPDPGTTAKRMYRRGAQTLTWEASDPNDDEIEVRLKVRPRDGGPWLLLRERPDSSPFSFDTEALGDGFWVARIEVSDAPANPSGSALVTGRDSEPFGVDNTPPEIELLRATGEGRRAVIEVRARDALAGLWKAEWAVDGGAFAPLLAADGLTDSREERYRAESAPLAPGQHLLALRVTDFANQSRAIAVPIEIGAASTEPQ